MHVDIERHAEIPPGADLKDVGRAALEFKVEGKSEMPLATASALQ